MSQTLSQTLDSIAGDLFLGRLVSARKKETTAAFLARRQGEAGAYAGMFAPTRRDFEGIRLFTGEALRSRAGIAHTLGEECCRILVLLQPKSEPARSALRRAVQGMSARLDESERDGGCVGMYCCGTCSASYWRNLAMDVFPRSEERLSKGIKRLAEHRTGDGQWRRFPFYFTSLVLTEIDRDLARPEIVHSARRWERLISRLSNSDRLYDQRRAAVGRRLLSMI